MIAENKSNRFYLAFVHVNNALISNLKRIGNINPAIIGTFTQSLEKHYLSYMFEYFSSRDVFIKNAKIFSPLNLSLLYAVLYLFSSNENVYFRLTVVY